MDEPQKSKMNINTKHPFYVVLYAGLISGIFTFAIMSLNALSQKSVEQNQSLALDRAFVEIFNLGDISKLSDQEIIDLKKKYVFKGPLVKDEKSGESFQTFILRKDSKVPAVAIPIWGMGFWARIDGYMAVTPDLKKTLGVVFLQHSETPGLGGRITEKKWRDKFKDIDITKPQEGNYIYVDSSPSKSKSGRHVDSITGATGTSSAVEKFINERLDQFRSALGEKPADELQKLISNKQEVEK